MIRPLNINNFNETNHFLVECQNCGEKYEQFTFRNNKSKKPEMYDVKHLKNLPRECQKCKKLIDF